MTQDVALLGLGTMGSGMASNLLKAGFSLSVYNRTRAKAQPFISSGARFAETPADAVQNASVVISMLSDDDASREVWLGKHGALDGTTKGAVLIESSTVSPKWIATLAEAAARHGAELIDAPVTGSRLQAEGGQLNFLVGGNDAALEKARPILKAMSKEIVHLGPIGSGTQLKLINNFLSGVQIASLAEAITWIERTGLDRDRALAVLKAGAPGSPLLSTISARMMTHSYDVNFLLKLMTKDLIYAQTEARNRNVELKTAKAAEDLFEIAIEKGLGDQDMSAVIEPLREKK